MIYFEKHNGIYQLDDGSELPTSELIKFPHLIEDDGGYIFIDLEEGDKVCTHTPSPETDTHSDLPTGVISRFTIFEGVLCAVFEETNVPHSVMWLSKFD